MKALDLIPFAGRSVAVTYVSGEVVRGRLRRTGAEHFVLSPPVIVATGSWDVAHSVDLPNVVDVVEEPALFFEQRTIGSPG